MEENHDIHVNIVADKPFIAGYFNLASNHLKELSDAIHARFPNLKNASNFLIPTPVNTGQNEDQCVQKEISEMSESDYQMLLDLVSSYFRAVSLVKRSSFVNGVLDRIWLWKRINYILILQNSLRNYYTHYCHPEVIISDSDFKNLLEQMFISSALDVKEKRLKGEQALRVIKSSFKDELKKLEIDQKKYLTEKTKENPKISLDDDSVRNATLNHLIYRMVKKNKQTGDYEINKGYQLFKLVEGRTDQWRFTDDGLAFFLGLFLTKKEGLEFRSRIKGFKDNNNLSHNVTQWVFSYPAFRRADRNFTTVFSKDAFIFQMIDELNKVPDEVYRNLPEEKQDEFLVDINSYFKDKTDVPGSTPEQETVVNPVIRKRYEDKFEYFALRYLDEFAGFTRIRFQVYVGDYIHDRREKKIGNSNLYTERECREKVKTFGKLTELQKVKTEYFEGKAVPEISGWRRFPNPSYRIENHNILLALYIKNEEIKDRIQKAQKALGNAGDKERSSRTEKPVRGEMLNEMYNKCPYKFNSTPFIAQMSLNELPALLYALLIDHKSPEDIEDQIIQTYQEHFHEIEKGEGKHLPKNLTQSDKEGADMGKLRRDIQGVIDDSDERLLSFDKLKREKSKGRNSRPLYHVFDSKTMGETVSFLAKDILRFMPVIYRENWKGYMHSEWQALLSHYEVNRQAAIDLLFSCWKTQNAPESTGMEILNLFQKSETFEELYEEYLKFRKQYMRLLLVGLGSADIQMFFTEKGVWNYFHKRLYVRDPTATLTDRLLARPIVLPRGIFDKKPTYIKGKNPEMNREDFADWYVYPYERECGVQMFYGYGLDTDRGFEDYRIFSESIRDNRYDWSEKHQRELFKKKELSRVKNVKRKDAFLYLMVKKMLEDEGVPFKLSLNDFYLPQEAISKRKGVALGQKNRQPGDKSENIRKETYIWNMTLPFYYEREDKNEKKHKVFYEEKVQVKDLRTLAARMTNLKVLRLFDYDPSHLWNRKSLESELSNYEKIRRENLLVIIQRFEREVLLRYGWKEGEVAPDDLLITDKKGKKIPNFKRYVFSSPLGFSKEAIPQLLDNSWLQLKRNYPQIAAFSKVSQGYQLIQIRNNFAHNKLPDVSFFRECTAFLAKDPSEYYSQYYFRLAEKIINLLENNIHSDA
jgi:hypothetical protein